MKTVFLLVAAAAMAAAQDAKFYRLDFTIKEMEEAKVVSTKKYSALASTEDTNKGTQIRAGSKVQYSVGGANSPMPQYQYADVGVNIDVHRVREAGGHLSILLTAELSSIPASDGPLTAPPLIRQNRWSALTTLEPSKPTVLFSSDDLNSKRRIQVELTATPVK